MRNDPSNEAQPATPAGSEPTSSPRPPADRTQQILTLIVLVLIVASFALLIYNVARGTTSAAQPPVVR